MVQQTNLLLQGQNPPPDFTRFVFFSTLCSYSFHYYFTTYSAIPSGRINWIQQNRPLLLFLFIAGLGGAVFYLLQLSAYLFWLLPAALAAFLYSAPKMPYPPFRQLRKFAFGKTIFLAFTWMYVTAVLPVITYGNAWNSGNTYFAASRFFYIYAICILFDYRDRDDDRAKGVKSLITILSEKNIDRIVIFSLLAFASLTIFMHNYGFSPLSIAILLTPGFILGALYNYAKKNLSDILYYIVLDGLLALSAVLLLITRI
jgi:4-hydroxybenzoate polyprenyltransferase